MTRFRPAIALALAFAAAAPAVATTYHGTRSFGGGLTGFLKVTTDGTLGVLGAANVQSLSITFSGLGEDAQNYGQHPSIDSGSFAPIVLQGTSLTATPTRLFFNFDSGSGTFGIDAGPYYLLYSASCNGCFGREFYELDPEFGNTLYHQGLQQIGQVPEPASWALLITGFGMVGATLRRRRALPAAA